MRSLMGLVWALVGGGVGFIVGAVGATIFASVTHMSNREGAQGYFMFAIGLLGAVIGIIAGLVLYGRSAPTGQGAEYSGAGALGFVGLIVAIVVGLWAFMQLREAPLKYGNALANLELEIRVKTANIPADASGDFLRIEVQTAKTRPEASVSWSSRRKEGEYTIVPAYQGPLYRSGSRVIVVRVGSNQVEAFMPPMKRTPDRKADWSAWYQSKAVDPQYGVVPTAPLTSMVELRYRVRAYGDE